MRKLYKAAKSKQHQMEHRERLRLAHAGAECRSLHCLSEGSLQPCIGDCGTSSSCRHLFERVNLGTLSAMVCSLCHHAYMADCSHVFEHGYCALCGSHAPSEVDLEEERRMSRDVLENIESIDTQIGTEREEEVDTESEEGDHESKDSGSVSISGWIFEEGSQGRVEEDCTCKAADEGLMFAAAAAVTKRRGVALPTFISCV